MASIDESLLSNPRKQKWIDEISTILNHQLKTSLNLIPKASIFQVPENVTQKKLEAYKKMEQKKLIAMQSVLQDHKINDLSVVLDKIRKLVPVIRGHYDMFLQDDDDSLAWVFAIDGLFLLHVLGANNNTGNSQFPSIIRDIMMVENQIPCIVLMEIYTALHELSSTLIPLPDEFLSSTFRPFCETHSPLELCSSSISPINVNHLLHCMYLSIVTNNRIVEPMCKIAVLDMLTEVSEFTGKIPKDEIVQVYKQTITTLETFTQSEIPMPSAYELYNKAGFRFYNLKPGNGIRDIYINGEKFVLPCVTLNKDSEVALRNLVAYEMLMTEYDKLITEYVGLMCELIVNTNDVKLLRKENIIKGEMSDDEIVELFTSMSSCIQISMEKKEKSELRKMVEEAKKVYDCRQTSKTDLVLKKLANWLLVILRAISGFVESSWKIFAFIISIGTIFLLTAQAYCDTYGCATKK